MCKHTSAEENQKKTVRYSGFTKKVYGLSCTVRKKSSRHKEDSAQQVQASLNSVLTPMQGATCTKVGVACSVCY